MFQVNISANARDNGHCTKFVTPALFSGDILPKRPFRIPLHNFALLCFKNGIDAAALHGLHTLTKF